jgi:hypothetical protein
MSSGLKNKWLDKADNAKLLEDLEEHMMNAWASDANIGEFIESLPDNLKNFFFKMNMDCPTRIDDAIEIKIVNP